MKYFKKSENKNNFNDTTYEKEVIQTVEEFNKEVEETEEITKNNVVTGIVVGCEKLNVRKQPSTNSEVLCVIDKSAEVKIDMDAKTTIDFYKVCTASGVEGYCMSKYIDVK